MDSISLLPWVTGTPSCDQAYDKAGPSDALLAEDHPDARTAPDPLAANEGADPLLATDRAQLRDAIRVALDYLPEPYGDILEWKYLRDVSIGEIGSRFGSPSFGAGLLCRSWKGKQQGHPNSEQADLGLQANKSVFHNG